MASATFSELKKERDIERREKAEEVKQMIPQIWTPQCGSECTHKFASVMQIPWRIFCKKGCDADCDSWEDCVAACSEICYKDPVLKDREWTAYIDRSPGAASYSQDCFKACVAGCGYKFDVEAEEVKKAKPKRPPPPPPKPQPPPRPQKPAQPSTEDVPGTSA